jgi:hypothetical protein
MRLTVILLFVTQLAFGQAFHFMGFTHPRESATPIPEDGQFVLYDNNAQDAANIYSTSPGGWGHGPKATNYLGTQSYNTTTNAYFERTFTGHKVEWHSEKYHWHGISAVSIDGGAETMVDQYIDEADEELLGGTQLLYTSPVLTEGSHTIRIRVTGNKNVLNVSAFNYLVHDFIKVYYTGSPPPTSTADRLVDPTNPLASESNPCTVSLPCISINRAAQVAVAGDVVEIKAGTYRETITPLISGSAGNPITFRAAPGETVIVSGLNVLNASWASYSGNVYRTLATLPRTGHTSTLNSNTGLLANQIFQGGTMQFEASTRNITTINDLFDKYKWKALSAANFPSTSATDAIFNGKSLTGATVVIQGWFAVDSRTVNAHTSNGNTIGFPGYSDNTSGGQQYRRWIYASNDLDLLDQAMEWHYDGTYLYLWQTGGGTPTGTIEYKARNWGFDLRSRAYINIEDITFKGCEPVTGNDATNFITVDNIRSTYANHSVAHQTYRWQGVGMTRQMGMKLTGTNNVLTDSEISYSSSQGVWIGANGRVENCYIHHIGYDGGWGAGIDLWGEDQVNNITITRNTISHTSRSSVSLGYAFTEFTNLRTLNLTISYNDFSEWCLFSDDGGALYTWGFRDHTGSTVHHNLFHDAGFVLNPLNLPVPGRLDGIAVAFYTDQGGGPFTVHHNIFWNNVEIPTSGSPSYTNGWDSDAADVYTQPTFQGGAGGYRNNGGSKFYNNTFWSNAPWTGKSNPQNNPNELFRNNLMRRTWNFFPASSPNLGGEGSNIYNSASNPLFVGGSLSTPLTYFQLQAGSPARGIGISLPGINDDDTGPKDAGALPYGQTPFDVGHDW